MKEWYCLFRGKKEGPFSVADLKRHPRFTPETMVWKKGYIKWVKASQVRELAKIFKEEKRRSKKNGKEKEEQQVGEIIAARQNPPPYLLFFIIFMIIVFFFFYLFYL